jgi:hypothetical protein
MRLIVDSLSKDEMKFLLELLNSAKSSSELFRGQRLAAVVSVNEAIKLDHWAEKLRRVYEQRRVNKVIRPKNAYFATPESDRKTRGLFHDLVNEWSRARIQPINAIVNYRNHERNFVHWPSIIGVPAHRPPVMINDPCDLVGWLVIRGMANRQLKRFVYCQQCRKFGIRKRARGDARFCSERCQVAFNRSDRKRKRTENFGADLATHVSR